MGVNVACDRGAAPLEFLGTRRTAVISGLARMPVRLVCIAGTAWRTRTGTAWPPNVCDAIFYIVLPFAAKSCNSYCMNSSVDMPKIAIRKDGVSNLRMKAIYSKQSHETIR